MSISPYRIKQTIAHKGQHYALVESPENDIIYRVSGDFKRWNLSFRIQKMAINADYLVLLHAQNFCKSYQLFIEDQISEKILMKQAFLLGDGFVVQKAAAGGGYRISNKSIEQIRKFGLDEESDCLLPSQLDLFDLVMLRDGVIFTSSATGIWEATLTVFWKNDELKWNKVSLPTTQDCKNQYVRWLGDYEVLVASDMKAQYQRLFCWNILSNDLKPLDSLRKDHILYQDSQLSLSNHKGYCEVLIHGRRYKTGFCRDFSKSDNFLTLLADEPASTQKLWTMQLGEGSASDFQFDGQMDTEPKALALDDSGHLVSSHDYAFECLEEKLINGSMLRFRPPNAVLGTVIFVHGGPGICEGHRMREITVEMVHRGFEVISFDATGSAGYGRTFRNRLNGQHGSLDLIELKQILSTKVEHFPVFLWGESYGGYLVLKAGIELSNIICGVINYYGVTDWLDAMLDWENLKGPLKSRMYKNFGNPNMESGRSYLQKISILPEAHLLSLPVLSIHGSEDKSVPLRHSEKLYEAMVNPHPLSKLLILPDEGHEIRAYKNRKNALDEVLEFLDRCLEETR